MRTHKVTVTPDAEAWKLELPGLGLTTHARRIDQVEQEAMRAVCLSIPMDPERAKIKFNFAVTMANPYLPDARLPAAVICDIDGTLARHDNRDPYDFDKIDTDVLNRPVAEALEMYAEHDRKIILLSGRQEEHRKETEVWLENNFIDYEQLIMRGTDDRRSDDLVKMELFDTHVRNNYCVTLVLDDRNRCVKLWRSLGLPCWQVHAGDF